MRASDISARGSGFQPHIEGVGLFIKRQKGTFLVKPKGNLFPIAFRARVSNRYNLPVAGLQVCYCIEIPW